MPAPTSRDACTGFEHVRAIVVGSALDAKSDDVLRTARDLAQRSGAALTVVHAAPMPALTPGMLLAEIDLLRRMADELEQQLQDQAARLQLGTLVPAPRLVVEDGPADLVLARIAGECAAELVVVGATTATGRLGKLLGSTAERLLAWGGAPILVVREALAGPPRRVLAPLDLSLLSRDAFRAGLRLLALLAPGEKISVEALLVVPPPAVGALPRTILSAGTELEDFLASTPVARHMRLVSRVLTGEARDQILRATEETTLDLVVIGTRATAGLRRALGSVTADVTREAPCNVLVVPPPEALGEAIAEAVEAQARPDFRADAAPPAVTPDDAELAEMHI